MLLQVLWHKKGRLPRLFLCLDAQHRHPLGRARDLHGRLGGKGVASSCWEQAAAAAAAAAGSGDGGAPTRLLQRT